MKVLSYQRLTYILNTTNETFKIRYCVNLYLNWHRKYERSKLRVPFLLSIFRHLNFDLSFFQCQLRYSFTQYLILKVSLVVLRVKVGLWCDSTFILCYFALKTAILLHKQGLVKTEVLSTVFEKEKKGRGFGPIWVTSWKEFSISFKKWCFEIFRMSKVSR